MPAATRIHRGDQLNIGGKGHMAVGARDTNFAGFQRLSQTVEYAALKLRQFVEEQDAEMGQADFARTNAQTTPDKGWYRSAMMRCTERTCAQ